MNLKVFFCEETLWLFTSYSGFKFQPWKKKLEKKKRSRIFEENKTISFGSNTSVFYPAEGIF